MRTRFEFVGAVATGAAWIGITVAAAASTEPGLPATVPRLTSAPPEIDGRLDDDAWAEARVIEGFRQVTPIEGGPPSEKTVVRLLYDANTFYVGVRCFDRDPAGIIATQLKRDGSMGADDNIAIVVDPIFDRRNGYYFEVNPLGAKGDALVENGGSLRRDWDGIWYAKSSVDDEGWVVEIAIPLQTITFDPTTDRWGFNVSRFVRRRNERIQWANPSLNQGVTAMSEAGVLDGIRDLRPSLGLDVKPYAVGTLKRDHEQGRNGLDVDAGLDLFYKLTPDLTLALTFNTDFAETEVDERRVNLTRFPLFFPEKRDFFLQDAGIFEFGGIRVNPRPFQSRRIGLGPDGRTIPILAGAKLTGRIGGLNLGLLDVETKAQGDLEAKNLFVGRASVNVLQQSTMGVIFTHGDPVRDASNAVAGADFNYRYTSDDQRTFTGSAWFLHSDSSVSGTDEGYGIRFAYPNDRVSWRVGAARIGARLDPGLGFVPRAGIHEYFGNWRYRWRPPTGDIRTVDTAVDFFAVTDLDHQIESQNVELELLSVRNDAGDGIDADVSFVREVLAESFEITDGVVIPAGDYRWQRYGLGLSSSTGRPLDVGLSWEGGDFYGGTRDDYALDLQWRVSPALFLGARAEINAIDLPQGDFITRILRGRVNVFFSPELSWTSFIQFDNFSESIGINSRVRWIIEPGNELFVVLNQDIDREENRFRVRRTELTTKLGWTFRF